MNFIYTKQKKQQDIVLDRPHVLISFIHWVNSTILKNVWLIVRQLPIRAGWWDAPLAIWYLDEAMRITRSKISYTVWSNLNRFFVHQPAATNSMHVQSTHTPHSQRLQWDLHLEHGRRSAVELFCGNSLCVKTVWFFRCLIVDAWQNSKYDSVWREGFHHWGYTGESCTLPVS